MERSGYTSRCRSDERAANIDIQTQTKIQHMKPKLPIKLRGDGRHLYCYQCKRTVTSDWDKDTNGKFKKASRCNHEKAVFYSILYSPIHKKRIARRAWPEIKDPQTCTRPKAMLSKQHENFLLFTTLDALRRSN